MAEVRSKQSVRSRSLAVAAAFGLLIATIAHAQAPSSVAGTWTGSIETPVGRLGIVVRLQQGDNDTWKGTIDIPQQLAKAVPLADVTVKAAEVSFKIAGPPGDPTIRLTLSENAARMSGTLTQGGGTIPVSFGTGQHGASAAGCAEAPADARTIVSVPRGTGHEILIAQAAQLFRAQRASEATIAWDRSVRERVFAVLKAETDGKPNEVRRQALVDEVASAKPDGPGAPDGAARARSARVGTAM